MGINAAVIGSVWVIGPALGGWLAEAYGYRNSFLIAGASAAMCSIGYAQLPETLKRTAAADSGGSYLGGLFGGDPGTSGAAPSRKTWREHFEAWKDDVGPIMQSPSQRALILQACVFPLRFSCFSTAVVLHLVDICGSGPSQIGVMFTTLALSQALAMPLGSWLADRTGGAKKQLVVPAGLVSAGGFAALAFASTQEHVLLAMALQGLAGGFVQPAVGAFKAEVTPPDKRGQANSLQRQASAILSLVGPIGMGLLADVTSCPTAIMISSGLMAGCQAAYGVLASNSEAELVSVQGKPKEDGP
jgi:MFS family permease